MLFVHRRMVRRLVGRSVVLIETAPSDISDHICTRCIQADEHCRLVLCQLSDLPGYDRASHIKMEGARFLALLKWPRGVNSAPEISSPQNH